MISTAHTRFWTVLLASVALVCGAPCALFGQDVAELPLVDLDALEPSVAEQLGSLRSHTQSVLAGEVTAGKKGEAVGELGRHFHAYELVEPAEACYRAAASLAPRDFRWRYHLGYLLQNAGRLEEAASEYERALGLHANVPPALVRLGQVYLALGQIEAAEDVLGRALQLDPASTSAYAVLGEVYLAQQRHSEAVAGLERALDYTPEATRLYYPLALAYRGLGEEDRARELMAQRGDVGVRPADPLIDGLAGLVTGERVHILRGRAAFGVGRFAEASEEFAAAVAANPRSIPARVNLGSALGQLGKAEEAIEHYRAAIELGPGNVSARFNLGVLLADEGRYEEAVTELRGAVQYGPKDAQAHYQLARALRRLGRLEDALTHFVLSSELGPPGELARLGQGATLVDLGRYAEARGILEGALEVIPTSARLTFALAHLLAACPDPAQRDGNRALVLADKMYTARGSVADALLVAAALAEIGRCPDAAEWQSQALATLETTAPPQPAAAIAGVRERLDHYQSGPPCRPPAATEPPATH